MLPGPIFKVEIVAAARRRRYFLMRVVFAALILCVLWATFASASAAYSRYGSDGRLSISQAAAMATNFFVAFTWMQLIGMLAVAPAMAVGTIAAERERRTIEYLFVTDLSNLEIVLGKTFARLLLIGQLALVSLPILFLFRLLGGIPADLLAASFLIAGSTALLVTAISVCVSVWSKRSRDATIRVYAVIAALLFVPLIALAMLGWQFSQYAWWQDYAEPALQFLVDLNPLAALGKSMPSIYAAGAGFDFRPVLKMFAWHAGLSMALVALATLAVRRVHLRESSRGSTEGSPSRIRRPLLPRWRPALGDRPVLWKEAFAASAKTKLGVAGALASAAIVITALALVLFMFFTALSRRYGGPGFVYYEFLSGFTAPVGAGLLLLLAARASSLVTLEKERDCWISLISTPLDGRDIVGGKWLGNLYAVRWGFMVLFLAWLLGVVLDVRYLAIVALSTLTFVVIAAFVTALGIYFSLRSTTSLRAMGLTLASTLFLGGGYLMCCCPLATGLGGGDVMALAMAPCMPFLLLAPSLLIHEPSEWAVVAAYCLGMIGYTAALVFMLRAMTANFDALAGRTDDMPDATRRAVIGASPA
jgi:ABC-type transport system involved in multi-copper enzyme maturation permease subunit